jgi:hypothetical protein
VKYWAGKALSWAVRDGQCVLATARLKRHAVCRRALFTPRTHARTHSIDEAMLAPA